MKTKILSIACILLGAILTMASCSDDDNYSPGEPNAEGAVGAYFSNSNVASVTVIPTRTDFDLTVSRLDSTAAADVAVNVEDVDTTGINFPSTVHFDAGQGTTTLHVTTSGLTIGESYHYTITIDPKQVDHYAIYDGSPTFIGTIVVKAREPKWEKRFSQVDFSTYYITDSPFADYYSDVYQFDNENQFYIDDFLGSGSKLYFHIDGTFDANDLSKCNGTMVFDSNISVDGDYQQFVTDDGSSEWTAPGESQSYESIYFYDGYSTVDFSIEDAFHFYTYLYWPNDGYGDGYMYGYISTGSSAKKLHK